MWNKSVLLFLCLAVFSAGCSQKARGPEDPKRRLTDYISRSFAVSSPSDREHLMGYLTGDVRTRLGAWSDDQFKQAFMDSKRQFLKLVINEVKGVSDAEVNVTYEISYVDQGKGKGAKVTNKKLCNMVMEQNNWFIKDVRNIKELVEYQNEMSLP